MWKLELESKTPPPPPQIIRHIQWRSFLQKWVNHHISGRANSKLFPQYISNFVQHWSFILVWTWWRHQMETLSALLNLYEGNLPITTSNKNKNKIRDTWKSISILVGVADDGHIYSMGYRASLCFEKSKLQACPTLPIISVLSWLYTSLLCSCWWGRGCVEYFFQNLFRPKWVHFQNNPELQGAVSIRKTVLPGMAIPMLKIRRPNVRLIFNMEIAIRR